MASDLTRQAEEFEKAATERQLQLEQGSLQEEFQRELEKEQEELAEQLSAPLAKLDKIAKGGN